MKPAFPNSHQSQKLGQILVPFLLATIFITFLGIYWLSNGTSGGKGLRIWADVSLVILIFALTGLMLTLFILITLSIAMLSKSKNFVLHKMNPVGEKIIQSSQSVKKITLTLTRPFLLVESICTAGKSNPKTGNRDERK